MKIVGFLLIMFGLAFGDALDDFASERGFSRNYEAALQQAKKEHKVLLLVLSKHTCGWCRRFEKRTLSDANIAKLLKKDFVVVVMDKNQDTDKYPSDVFVSYFTPKSFFIDPNTQVVLLEGNGYIKKEDFVHTLARAKKRLK